MKFLTSSIFFISMFLLSSIAAINLKKSESMVSQSDELVINGGFESSSNGWKGVPEIELNPGKVYNLNWNSQTVVELDGNQNDVISQTLQLKHGYYTLSFDYAAREGVSLDSNKGTVNFNGEVVAVLNSNDYSLHNAKVRLFATQGTNVLEFVGAGKSDSLGLTIDNISILNSSFDNNLVANGDFEYPKVPGGYGAFIAKPEGWDVLGANIAEIGSGNIYNNWGNGQVVELDADANIKMFQYIRAETGAYMLRFKAAARQGVALESNKFIVRFNGNEVLRVTPNNYDIVDYNVKVIAFAGMNLLEFYGDGTSDTLGATIDQVKILSTEKDSNLLNNGNWSNGTEGWSGKHFEINPGKVYNSNWGDFKVLELDGDQNDVISYSIYLKAGMYKVRCQYAAREGLPVSTSQGIVKANGVQIGSMMPADYSIQTSVYPLTANDGMNTITFEGAGASDSLGLTITNIELIQ